MQTIEDLKQRYGLRSRSSVYAWLRAVGTKTEKDERNNAVIGDEWLPALDELKRHLDCRGTLDNFRLKTKVKPKENPSPTSPEALEKLVGAIAEMKVRSPIANQDDLHRAWERGYVLSTSQVQHLVGARPSGDRYKYGGWRFTKTDRMGKESGWRVEKERI